MTLVLEETKRSGLLKVNPALLLVLPPTVPPPPPRHCPGSVDWRCGVEPELGI